MSEAKIGEARLVLFTKEELKHRLRKNILAANGRAGMRTKASQFTRKC